MNKSTKLITIFLALIMVLGTTASALIANAATNNLANNTTFITETNANKSQSPTHKTLTTRNPITTTRSSPYASEPSTTQTLPNNGAKQCGKSLTWSFDSDTGTLSIAGTGAMYEYSFNYHDITSAPWKEYYDKIKRLVVSDEVTKIGGSAFSGCTNINYLEIPISTAYSYDSFYNCNNIKTIKITEGNGNTVDWQEYKYYGYAIPWRVSPQAKIIFDNNVESIGDYMFSGCKISDVSLSAKLKYIGECAFSGCNNLQSITIPNFVECIEDRAFVNCSNLKYVNLGNSKNLAIKYDVFNGCNSIEKFVVGLNSQNYYTDNFGVLYNKNQTGLIKYPAASALKSYTVNENTAYINEFAFESSQSLEEIILPKNMMSIGSYAFKDCTSLKEAIIPNGLSTLCYASFDGCSAIEKIVLPESLETLGGHSFRDCVNLKEVIYNCKNCADITNNNSPFYNAGSESGGFKLTFTDSVNTIPDCLFFNYYDWDYSTDYGSGFRPAYNRPSNYKPIEYYVSEICIGKNVIEASSHSFVHLNKLNKVNYNATDCLYLSFIECQNLTDVNIGENVQTIPTRFLYDCKNVCNIFFPDNICRIGCDSITGTGYYNNNSNWNNGELRIDNKLIKVDEKISEKYTFHPDVTVVADKAFLSCKITEITIPSKIITLGYRCFENITELNKVYFNAASCQYADSSFYGSGIESFIIGDKVTTLPVRILSGCNNIYELQIPENVLCIGSELFGYEQTIIKFIGTERINISQSSGVYRPRINAVIYCKQNSFIHSYLTMCSAPFFLYNDMNDVFKIENDVLDSYIGKSEHVFVNFANKIGYGAFENNSNIKSVELASSVTTIFNAAFKNCKNLKSIIIPQNVSSIGENAFSGCDKLTIWCYSGSYAESFAKSKNIKTNNISLQLSEQEIILTSSERRLLKASFSTILDGDNKITWSSDDTSVVKVSSSGEIIAVNSGTARVTAKSDTGLYATCLVKVTDTPQVPEVRSVKIDDISINYKKSITINPTIEADNGAKYTISYTSSNPKIVTVNEDGKIYAAKKGSATITCTVTDQLGNISTDTCTVTVKYTFAQWLIKIILFGWIWY